jgi:iron complex transport system ATP-binding protein
MKAVEVEGLTAGYGTGADLFHHPDRAVLHDLSLSLEEGVPVTLLGPNGCGKTTFLRTLIGLLPYQGHVKIFGRELSKMKRKEIALNMAMMSQLSDQYFSYSIRETVEMGRFVRGVRTGHDREVVDRCLEMTGLKDMENREIRRLSGGQLQRVYLARTLAQETPLILLDEPTNHLDLRYQAELMEYLLAWSKGSTVLPDGRVCKNTLIGVFHDIGLAAQVSEYMVFLKKGRILAAGPKADTLSSRILEETYEMDVASYMRSQKKIWDEIQ